MRLFFAIDVGLSSFLEGVGVLEVSFGMFLLPGVLFVSGLATVSSVVSSAFGLAGGKSSS